MKQAKTKAGGLARGLPGTFLRGAIATGMVAALQDKRGGKDLMQAALIGGTALSTAVTVEELLFNKEWKLAKKMKGGKKNKRGGMDMAALARRACMVRPATVMCRPSVIHGCAMARRSGAKRLGAKKPGAATARTFWALSIGGTSVFGW